MRYAGHMSSLDAARDEAQVLAGVPCNLNPKLDSPTHRRSGASSSAMQGSLNWFLPARSVPSRQLSTASCVPISCGSGVHLAGRWRVSHTLPAHVVFEPRPCAGGGGMMMERGSPEKRTASHVAAASRGPTPQTVP